MKLYRRTRYLRIIFTLLPFSVVSLIGGIKQFNDIPKELGELIKYEGIVSYVGPGQLHLEKFDDYINVTEVKLHNDKVFNTAISEKRKIIEQLNIHKGDSIIIWTNGKNNSIKQVKYNGKLEIAYKPPFWMAWFFTILGIVLTGLTMVYIIKYSSDFFG